MTCSCSAIALCAGCRKVAESAQDHILIPALNQLRACRNCRLDSSLRMHADRAAASAGQSGLMALYDTLFAMMDLQASQLLVTPRDFRDENFKVNLRETTEELLSVSRVIPVFNENDAISDRSLDKVRAASAPRLSVPARPCCHTLTLSELLTDTLKLPICLRSHVGLKPV